MSILVSRSYTGSADLQVMTGLTQALRARGQLYHLIEDDWLTYYATRIGSNLGQI